MTKMGSIWALLWLLCCKYTVGRGATGWGLSLRRRPQPQGGVLRDARHVCDGGCAAAIPLLSVSLTSVVSGFDGITRLWPPDFWECQPETTESGHQVSDITRSFVNDLKHMSSEPSSGQSNLRWLNLFFLSF